nr:immunoglobulin light chain junction region [Macaca mulatta]
CQQHYTYPCSF